MDGFEISETNNCSSSRILQAPHEGCGIVWDFLLFVSSFMCFIDKSHRILGTGIFTSMNIINIKPFMLGKYRRTVIPWKIRHGWSAIRISVLEADLEKSKGDKENAVVEERMKVQKGCWLVKL